jgi:hypothetical protein
LRLDPAAYPGLAQLPAQLQAGTVDGMNVTRAEVANNVLRVAAATGPVLRTHGRYGWSNFDLPGLVTGQKLLDLFVFVYTQLATARGEGVQRP